MYGSLCLNSVLDISNQTDGGQKKLFSNEEWKIIVAQYDGRKIRFSKKEMEVKTQNINGVSVSSAFHLDYIMHY